MNYYLISEHEINNDNLSTYTRQPTKTYRTNLGLRVDDGKKFHLNVYYIK